MLPSEQDVPAHPASQRGATSLQTQEVTHITEITLPSRPARLPTLPVSQSALMRPDIYISLYPVLLTLKLISKMGSQASPPAQLATTPRASVNLPAMAVRLGTRQRCRTHSGGILTPPPGAQPKEATIQETL